MIKRIVALILLIVTAWYVYINRAQLSQKIISATTTSQCDHTIEYTIGSLDPQFGTTPQKVQDSAQKAAAMWNKQLGKDLFVYSPIGDLDINLLFDERQRLLIKAAQNKELIEQSEQKLKISSEEYDRRASELTNRVSALNDKINYWNSKGGAPAEEYKKLIQEQRDLNEEIAELNKYGATLNMSIDSLEDQVAETQDLVEEFNSLLVEAPEEGLYDPNEELINIYFYDSEARFLHTLTHEFGHALGLNHTQNSQSIMYPMTSESLKLSNEDIAELTSICKVRYPKFLDSPKLQYLIAKLYK